MCGITGIISRNEINHQQLEHLERSIERISKRGPDASGLVNYGRVAFGHRRLSIIDTTETSNQPMEDISKRYSIVFNGEIYNYLDIKKELLEYGYKFQSEGDTEVILQAYAHYGTSFLNKLNGFFSLAIYDREENSTLVARDRFGIKPLITYKSDTTFVFASEMKAILEFDIPRELDQASLFTYLQLNYVPEPHSMLSGIKKLEPGHYLKISSDLQVQKIPFYQLDYPPESGEYLHITYNEAQARFLKLLESSVQKRLVADVPLGTFLSGGIDSSLVTAIAARNLTNLNTFSVGFSDDPHFDETEFALAVSKKYKTNHHVFSLSRKDLLGSLHETLNYLDEPFADSSALAVNALSKQTAKYVKVALSGDGADEMFAGYHKHAGEYLMRRRGIKQKIVSHLGEVWKVMPKSRNSTMGNLFRKLHKFSIGFALSNEERYWLWAGLMNEPQATNLMLKNTNADIYAKRKEQILHQIKKGNDFNDVLYTDMKMVLLSDMLRKVDMMSMAHSLEVRTPFLDHELVNFAFQLESSFKIDASMKKKVVQDAAKNLLPKEVYNRPKKGFEIPLQSWLVNELSDLINKDLLSDSFIKSQNLFNLEYVKGLKQKINSSNPNDSQANVWALLVFNSWWKKYLA